MKFYIDKGTEIFLFQVLKAAGLIPNYEEVREAVQTEKVKVNGKAVDPMPYFATKFDGTGTGKSPCGN